MQTPLLSIGIIFKNEIRCLERCLKSLQPLRKAIPCELVMADTGSEDGSRAVAEKYADILFDFPWINDFSAARNAVIDRCTGKWYMTVDADEWLDKDFVQLVQNLKKPETEQYNVGAVVVRNYNTMEFDEEGRDYNDFLAVRIIRMSSGLRYTGAIHERWNSNNFNMLGFGKVVFHHDGYANLSQEKKQEKVERNMTLLRERLEQEPDSLITLLQCIESSGTLQEEHLGYVLRAVAGVKELRPGWESLGPVIMRHAMFSAQSRDLPEFDEWDEMANHRFADSMYTRIDVRYMELLRAYGQKEYEQAIQLGESYLQALRDYREGRYDPMSLTFSTLSQTTLASEYEARLIMADAYTKRWRYQEGRDMLLTMDCAQLRGNGVGNYLGVLLNIHGQGGIDMSQQMVELWGKLSAPESRNRKARIEALISGAARVFTKEYIKGETDDGVPRHGYTAFLPLADECELGMAAQILAAGTADEMAQALCRVKTWQWFPITALAHALEHGVRFPLPDKQMNVEELDSLAARLSRSGAGLVPLALGAAERPDGADWPGLLWAQALVTAAVRAFAWGGADPDETQGMALARAFARTEGEFVPRCYAPELLQEGRVFALPPLHRFGLYCARAFQALDAGDAAGYVRLLREGLTACEGMKDMAEFLLKHTPELKNPSDELKALAEQIRAVLAKFPPDNPAVAMLRQSEAYQKVAYLIEGTQPPVVGGLLQ